MILILDLCYHKDSLSWGEFVRPIEQIVQACGVSFQTCYYREADPDPAETEGVILCGTALQDDGYLRHLDAFAWLRSWDLPVLGICAGMQVQSRVLGGGLVEGEEIGMTGIRVIRDDSLLQGIREFSAYSLHRYAVIPPPSFEILAVSDTCPQVIRHVDRPLYGVLFHPEVRNEWVVRRFLTLLEKR
jgi:GMP synthase-like glutamine amidotransferase